MRAGRSASSLAVFLVLLGSAVVQGGLYHRLINVPKAREQFSFHRQILDGSAPCPYRYRLLVPLAIESLRAVSPSRRPLMAFRFASYAATLAIFVFLFAALYAYFRQWFGKPESLSGVLCAASTMAVAMRDHFYQPWSFLEPGLFAIGLLFVRQRRDAAFVALTAVAALNRETAVFLPMAFAFMRLGPGSSRRDAMVFAASFAAWGAVFFGLVALRGWSGYVLGLDELWALNLRFWRVAVRQNALFLGFVWILAAAGWRKAAPDLRRSALIVPFYLVSVAVFGIWYEVRLLMSLYPILLGLALFALFPPRECNKL
jgi:hypothetical protein